MKKISMGILADVDAGKTTLTESILLNTGMIRSAGRVDNGDAFLDTEELEKKRGVTILSKQAIVNLAADNELNKSGHEVKITIIDTPGHADFIGEAERALSVLDVAVLLVSGPDGVTASTRRLAGMLRSYKVPFYIFVNKMDMCEKTQEELELHLQDKLGAGCIFIEGESKLEEMASLSDRTIEKYLEEGKLSEEDITGLIFDGSLHPVLFGAALKNEGVDGLISAVTSFLPEIKYRDSFSAKVFKMGFEDGHKLSFVKVTGGSLAVRSVIDDERLEGEKVSQIRSYSGGKFESVEVAEAGDVVALFGLDNTYIGMGIGEELDADEMVCQPVLRYDLELPMEVPLRTFIPKLKELLAENPLLYMEVTNQKVTNQKVTNQKVTNQKVTDQNFSKEKVTISVMGEFQLEILQETILERYGVKVHFTSAGYVYKETISEPVIGFGHFEPLRHYAEVQILMEPLPRGGGIEIASDLSVNELDINWQKTILSTISEHLPLGVLTGSALTDIRFTLVAGRAHLKHTDSQDFREAVRRAIRQGLMKAKNILLEPQYEFVITLPSECVGRAMTDITQMGGECILAEEGVLTGKAPARCVINYQTKLTEFSSGRGSMELKLTGYTDMPEDVAEEVLENSGYDPENDKDNLSGSVFISHGAGYYVPWFECEELMHLPSREEDYFEIEAESDEERLEREAETARLRAERLGKAGSVESRLEAIGTDEIDSILRSATHSNEGKENRHTKRVYLSRSTVQAENRANYSKRSAEDITSKTDDNGSEKNTDKYARKQENKSKNKSDQKKKYLLVDGYNIIHAWNDLKDLLADEGASREQQSLDLESARFKLLDIMSEYRVLKDTEIIVVYDAYKIRGHVTEKMDYLGVHVVYTKEAETADQYIARFTLENSKNLDITVATSDGLIQLIIRGENSKLMTARELEHDVKRLREDVMNL